MARTSLYIALLLFAIIAFEVTGRSCRCSSGQVYDDKCGNEYAICYKEKWRCDHVKGGYCSSDRCVCSKQNKPIGDTIKHDL